MSQVTTTGKASRPSHHHPSLGGADIAQLLTSTGPIVKAVLLHCRKKNGDMEEIQKPIAVVAGAAAKEDDEQPITAGAATKDDDDNDGNDNAAVATRVVLTDMIEQIEIDTTPNKSMVAKTLGGPFTFLGQYEEEGIVLMIRNLPDDLDDVVRNERLEEAEDDDDDDDEDSEIDLSQELPRLFKVSQLKTLCHEREIDTEGMLEKADLVKALLEYQANLPPYNPHQLQPPLHKTQVRGDILCLKVAETAEELDEEEEIEEEEEEEDAEQPTDAPSTAEDQENKASSQENGGNSNDDNDLDETAATKEISVMPNDEFFLDYTKDEYIQFASRTDIPEHTLADPEAAEEEEEDDAEEEGVAFIPWQEGEEIDEEDKNAMFNLVMNEVLRQYREDNGRGPNTKELLELRASIAKELDVEVAQVPEADWDKKAKGSPSPSSKKIAFQKEDIVKEYVPDENEYNHGSEPDARAAALLGLYQEDDDEEDDDENEDNHDAEPDATEKAMLGADHEEEEEEDDEDDDDYSEPPPSKRFKSGGEE
ncbi:hypothetical protein IV203_035879 [Nitzschia inconspicua]|uniref:DUF5880 domain-containing protein n=1 Tax=Nitzschia inconspicua TaxID=303405 RepID=A0A9K3LF64_9STRA|nr:hypothetical protein IV203_035879 [Nitzschia inconspicua]